MSFTYLCNVMIKEDVFFSYLFPILRSLFAVALLVPFRSFFFIVFMGGFSFFFLFSFFVLFCY